LKKKKKKIKKKIKKCALQFWILRKKLPGVVSNPCFVLALQ